MSQIFENQNNSEDTGRLLKILPSDLAARVESSGDLSALTEIVLDVGREPLARFGDREAPLADTEADYDLIDRISANVGEFDLDNRAGMIRTLHRISAIRNRKGRIIGLTIRIGRAIFGTAEILRDLIDANRSILIRREIGRASCRERV